MLEKEIERIVLKEKEDEVIPFLQNLTFKEKKSLVPFLKKFKEKIFEMKEVRDKSFKGILYSYKATHTEIQRDLVCKACFVCFNKTDIKRVNIGSEIFTDPYLENILPWYTPKWYSDYINEEIPWGLTYSRMMELYKMGKLEPSRALICAKLPNIIIENKAEDDTSKSYYNPDALLEYKETLEEHIWLLFEEETSINHYYHFLDLINYDGGNNDVWMHTLKTLVSQDKIDKDKIIQATLLTSTRGFNKNLSGWFFNFLIVLELSEKDILNHQDELFAAINSPHSKVVNEVLNYFKKIANHKKFSYRTFIENASTLLHAEVKSVVTSTLMILDKIAKTHKSARLDICLQATEALMHTDNKIQLRAAKTIEKYSDSQQEEIVNEVAMYADYLLHDTKELLKAYLTNQEDEVAEEVIEIEEVNFLADDNQIQHYQTVDELIFFISQVLDNNETYHIDLLLSYLPKLHLLLDKTNVGKLEPIFKRAFDLSISFEWSSRIGHLEIMAAFYLNDFSDYVCKKFPKELSALIQYKDAKVTELKQDSFFNQYYKENLKPIEKQSVDFYIYQIYKNLFVFSKTFIHQDLKLDLLSMPTHAPCWISPNALVDRIISYEKAEMDFDLYDFQIAVGRIPLNNDTDGLAQRIDRIKNNEVCNVLKYHFNLIELTEAKIAHPSVWIQSVLCRNVKKDIAYFQNITQRNIKYEIGNYDWTCEVTDFFYNDYDYASKKLVKKKMQRKLLHFIDYSFPSHPMDSWVSSIQHRLSLKKNNSIDNIYQWVKSKPKSYNSCIYPNDEIKFLYISPNHPNVFLNLMIQSNLRESTLSDESSKKAVINNLKGLYEIWYRSDKHTSTYLFLATTFICNLKVARELAAEIWIKTSAQEQIDNTYLGEIIGKLEYNEYAPLKRFTDLISTHLYNISSQHNKALFVLLENMMIHLNVKPLRGLKKLLQIYFELSQVTHDIEISKLVLNKLETWNSTKSQQPIIKKILNQK